MQNINPERGHLWTQALLSGEYQQAQGSFIEVVNGEITNYCCLAVATDVAIKHGCEDVRWGEGWTVLVRYDESQHGAFEDHTNETDDDGTRWVEYGDGDLPKPVSDWLGIVFETDSHGYRSPAHNPDIDGVHAISRNDSNGDNFATIAKAIEADIARVEARS